MNTDSKKSMAKHRPRRKGKNDKIPYYIVGALVLIFIVVAFPKTGLFTTATYKMSEGAELKFQCDSVTGSTKSCPKYSDDMNLQEDDVLHTTLIFTDITDVAGIEFKLKNEFNGEELVELTRAEITKNCITPYYECTSQAEGPDQCDDNNEDTIDSCSITNGNTCLNIQCYNNGQCGEGEFCSNKGTEDSKCEYIECYENSECKGLRSTVSPPAIGICENNKCLNLGCTEDTQSASDIFDWDDSVGACVLDFPTDDSGRVQDTSEIDYNKEVCEYLEDVYFTYFEICETYFLDSNPEKPLGGVTFDTSSILDTTVDPPKSGGDIYKGCIEKGRKSSSYTACAINADEDYGDDDSDGIRNSKDACPEDASNECLTQSSESNEQTSTAEKTLYEGEERCDTTIESAVGTNYVYEYSSPFDRITSENNVVTIQQDTNTIKNYHISRLEVELDIKLLKTSKAYEEYTLEKSGVAKSPLLTLENFNIFDKSGDTNAFSHGEVTAGSKTTIDLKDTDSDGTPDVQEPEGIVAGTNSPFYEDSEVWLDDDGDGAGDGLLTNDKCPNTDCGLDESNCLRDMSRGYPLYGCAENQIDDDGDGVLNMILGDDNYMHQLDLCGATNWLDSDNDGMHDNAKDDLGRDVTFDDTTGCTSDATFMISQAAVLATDIVDRAVLFTDAGLKVGLDSSTNTRCTKTRTTTTVEWKDVKETCADFTLTLDFSNSKTPGILDDSVTLQLENNDVASVNVLLPELEPGEYGLTVSIKDAADNTELASIPDIPVRINMGDVNNDGKVSTQDILLLQRAVEGYGAEEGLNLDINLDGEDANIGDLIKLKNIFVKR